MTDIVERINRRIRHRWTLEKDTMLLVYAAEEIERLRANLYQDEAETEELETKLATVVAENDRLRKVLLAFEEMLSNSAYDIGELLEEYSKIVRSTLEGK